MKELSIEEKAKAYDEAINRMKHYVIDEYGCSRIKVANVFPELAESEDERIRKALIEGFKVMKDGSYGECTFSNYNIPVTYIIAWLENQGEQSDANKEYWRGYNEGKQCILDKYAEIEKQGQKPADKVELKVFKIGDIITNGILVGKIDEIHEFGYHAYFGDHYADVPDIENWHKWTIQDAKAGDVLCCESGWTCIFKTLVNDENFSSYCFMDNTKWFCETGSEGHTLKEEFVKAYNGKIYPATKEQRDLLFQKMREAGYEWDAEKKELKRIEQNPTWSKEDKDYYDTIIAKLEVTQDDALLTDNQMEFLKSLKNRVQLQSRQEWKQENIDDLTDFENVMMHIGDSFFGQYAGLDPNDTIAIKEQATILLGLVPKQEWSEEDSIRLQRIINFLWHNRKGDTDTIYQQEKDIEWLKSLRAQNRWKPSDEQMEAMENAIKPYCKGYGWNETPLGTLYNNLKKLKG